MRKITVFFTAEPATGAMTYDRAFNDGREAISRRGYQCGDMVNYAAESMTCAEAELYTDAPSGERFYWKDTIVDTGV